MTSAAAGEPGAGEEAGRHHRVVAARLHGDEGDDQRGAEGGADAGGGEAVARLVTPVRLALEA